VIVGGIKPSENELALKTSAQLSRFGRDAICFIVNPKNPISELRLSQIADILSGKITTWSAVGGLPVNLRLLLPLDQDGRREYLQDTLGIALSSRAETIVTDAQLLEKIFKDSSAIGITSMATALPFLQADDKLRDTTRFKVLGIRANEQGASAVVPFQAFVAQGKYPLAYDIYAYFRTNLGNYPSGFSAFLNSGDENQGQAILLVAGLVPTRVRIQLTK
jgi:phosphate transport system substrate-binding protein